MSRIKYDSDLIKFMTMFESMTGARVKDCIDADRLILIVDENEMGKAIGKEGSNIRRVENAFKKKIKLVEFSSSLAQFIRNFVHPAEVMDIKEENGTVTIHGRDMHARAMLIGREKQNLLQMQSIVQRFFDIKEVKVV